MPKLPAFQFYPGDWMKDPNLRRCSHSAKGVWIDILCLMFESEERGVLATAGRAWSEEEIALAVGGDQTAALACVQELTLKGVVARRADGALYSKRLVRDERKRTLCIEAGKRGGNPKLTPTLKGSSKGDVKGDSKGDANPNSTPSSSSSTSIEEENKQRVRATGFPSNEKEARDQAAMIGVDPDYAATVWHEIEGRGGTDSNGNPVRNFASHVKSRSNYRRDKNGKSTPKSSNEGAKNVRELM